MMNMLVRLFMMINGTNDGAEEELLISMMMLLM